MEYHQWYKQKIAEAAVDDAKFAVELSAIGLQDLLNDCNPFAVEKVARVLTSLGIDKINAVLRLCYVDDIILYSKRCTVCLAALNARDALHNN